MTQGVAAWVLVMIVSLNLMWQGCAHPAWAQLVKPAPFSSVQLDCLAHLQEVARRFVIAGESGGDKIPRTPLFSWSYTGEILELSQPVKFIELAPGRPPPGLGGSLRCVDFCGGSVLEALLSPHLLVLSGEELPAVLPRPRVQGSLRQAQRHGSY